MLIYTTTATFQKKMLDCLRRHIYLTALITRYFTDDYFAHRI